MDKTKAVERRTGRIEELIRKLESSADPGTLATARDLVQSLMELYGAGLDRLTEIISTKGAAGREILEELGRDELMGNLLAANGLHPLDLETRVKLGLEKLRKDLHGQGSVELLGIEDGVVRMRVRAVGSFRPMVEAAMYEAAPDLAHLEIEMVEDRGAASGFVALEKLVGYSAPANGSGSRNGAGI